MVVDFYNDCGSFSNYNYGNRNGNIKYKLFVPE